MEMNYSYTGIEDRMVKFIEQIQLKKKEIWKLFSNQFIGCADTHDYGWRGEYWGKLMRGACMTYQYTQDRQLYKILENTVEDMIENADENGRLSTYSISKEFDGWDIWSRKYVLLGFLYFHEICVDEEMKSRVVATMRGHLDYIIAHIGNDKINICDTSPVWQGVNSASILEPVVMLYNITHDRNYIDFAQHIVNSGGAKEFNIFEAAFENELELHEYPVRKAYEIMSCFEGLIEYYKVTGEKKWKIAAENFAERLITSEITIIGCAGCEHECFNNSNLMQTYTMYDGLMQETCVTVTWMKLCYKLLCLTGKSIYADEIEKSAYNALYGAVNTDNATNGNDTMFDLSWFKEVHKIHTAKYGPQPFDSYSPLRLGTRGRGIGGFRPMRDNSVYSGCCIAIGAAGVALLPLMSVMRMNNDVAFNLYLDGSVKTDDFAAEIKSTYLIDGCVQIHLVRETKHGLKFRIPCFSKKTNIKINDESVDYVLCDGYAIINRSWSKGDTINIKFDMNPRMLFGKENETDNESKNHVAFLYGPLVLARDARLSQVGTEIEVDTDKFSFRPIKSASFETICEFEVNTGREVINMIDYASAGKTWDNNSKMEAWIKMKV